MSCGGAYFVNSVVPCVYTVPLLLSLFSLYVFLMFSRQNTPMFVSAGEK